MYCPKCGCGVEGFYIARSKEWPRKMSDGVLFCVCGSFVRYSYLTSEYRKKLRDLRRQT